MPVTRPNVALYNINNLRLDYDERSGRYGLSLDCPHATAFTLCLGRNLPLANPEQLELTEEDLRMLHMGQSLNKKGYRLIGVASRTFYAMPVFRGFETEPPQTIQVWSMRAAPDGAIYLYYTPDREAVRHVPLRYSVQVQRSGPQTTLKVTLSDQLMKSYANGALMYQVGSCSPIPLPSAWLNRDIPLQVPDGEDIRVLAASGQENNYRREDIK